MAVARSLVLLVALALCATGCAWGGEDEPRAKRGPLSIGITANLLGLGGDVRARHAQDVRRLGVRLIREELEWRRLERSPGRYRWGRIDRLMRFAADRGLTVLPLLSSTPARQAESPQQMPRNPRSYARFVAAVVARYGPSSGFWTPETRRYAPRWFELYNEPYLALELADAEPVAYARTVRAAVEAGRATDPAARFLIAGEVTARDRDNEYTPWLAAMFDSDPAFASVVDGVAVHPYSGADSPSRYTPGEGDRFQAPRIQEIHAELTRRGIGDRPVWITEIGWSTCRGGTECVNADTQARHFEELLELVRTRWTFVRAVLPYRLRDLSQGRPGADKEPWFGLFSLGGAPKPAARVVARAAGGRP